MNIKLLVGIIAIVLISIILVLFKFIIPKTDSSYLELTMEKNAGIPFKWVYDIKDKDIVEFVKSYVSKDENTGAIVGAPVYTNYVFKGLKRGVTTITFKLVNIDNETDVFKEQVNTVEVDENNNISLVVEPSN